MRNRIRFGILLLLAVVALLFFRQTRRFGASQAVENEDEKTTHPATNKSSNLPRSAPVVGTATSKPSTNVVADARMEVKRKTAELMTTPIDFWGKVVDQQDQPVPNASVELTVRDWSFLLHVDGAHYRKHSVQTDAQGLFSLTNEKGDSLSVEAIEKDGYTLYPSTKKTFSYSGTDQLYSPVPTDPHVFRLWKRSQPEALIFKRAYARLPSDGTPLTVDLVRGLSSTNVSFAGDITIRMLRAPQNIEKIRRYDWEVSIQVHSGGGIQPKADTALYVAPESGYQPSLELRFEADQLNWANSTNLAVFLNHRQGKFFSRVLLKLDSHSLTGQNPFGFEAFINPAGSRNLEDDPRLRVEPSFQMPSAPTQPATPPPGFPPPGFPALPPQFTPPTNNPAFPQPPPGFQALTNRGRPFPPPAPPRSPQ